MENTKKGIVDYIERHEHNGTYMAWISLFNSPYMCKTETFTFYGSKKYAIQQLRSMGYVVPKSAI